MDKLTKSIEVLRILSNPPNDLLPSTTTPNERSRNDPIVASREKISHLATITEILSTIVLNKNNTELVFRNLSITFELLFYHCDENDQDVRLAAEENLNKLIKSLKENHLLRIQVEIHRVIRRTNAGTRALRGALSRFAELSALIFPKKARMFVEHMLPSFCSIATRSEEMLYEKLPDSFDLIFRVLGRSMNDQEIKTLIAAYFKNLSHESALVRRSSAACLICFIKYSRYPFIFAHYLLHLSIDQLLESARSEGNSRMINGQLTILKNLVQWLGCQSDELFWKNGTQNSLRNQENREENSPIQIRHFVECFDLICYFALNHTDQNIISGSLETLEIILKYSTLFDFDQSLISTKLIAEIEETRVSRSLSEISPNYQRSIIDSTNEKLSSAGKLVEQIISKYILNPDGGVKSDLDSRVTVKCVSLSCLAHLSTIDPFSFFESFQYPSEIICYLLALKDHQDSHLRSAFSNLLGKLIQTTIRFLNISPTLLSISNTTMSTDSQDEMQFGILNELLSTFRQCLNDKHSGVVHNTIISLRTLLPVLFENNLSLARTGIEFFEDALGHVSNSYALTKVALGQLIGAIDFRLLSYLEQQQAKKTNRSWLDRCIDAIFIFLADTDSRVRQAAALTFASFIDRTTFTPVQWPIHYLLRVVNSSCQWIYEVHHPLQPLNHIGNFSIVDAQSESISCLSTLIFERLAQASTRTELVGCLEGIHALVNALTPKTIRAFFHHQFDEFRLLIHFFQNPFVLHDLNNLQLLLDIVKVLFRNLSGIRIEHFDSTSSEKVFHFLIKILSLFACAIEDIQPSSTPASKINFPSIQTSPKSFKKRSETSKDDSKIEKESQSLENSTSSISTKDSLNTSTNEKEKKIAKTNLGAIGNNPSMMKLFDLIRSAFQTSKSVISSNENDRFSQVLSSTLSCIAEAIHLVPVANVLQHLEETLNYLKSAFQCDKVQTVECTRRLLEILHQFITYPTPISIVKQTTTNAANSTLNNLHSIVIRQPMLFMFGSRQNSMHNTESSQHGHLAIQQIYLSERQRKNIEFLKHIPSRMEKTKVGTYIRAFENVVILSLRKYPYSPENDFQGATLQLLFQLLLLRVNYSLLDADDHFLNQVIAQLEMMEDNIVEFDISPDFISRICEYLVALSHDTVHQRQVIKVQDLIKHCDLLVVNERLPPICALAALEPVVHDLYLVRSKNENKELEAQRMVIVQILLRLIGQKKTIELLTVILDSVRNETEKWHRLSRQIIDAVLVHLQSMNSWVFYKDQNLLELYSSYLILFDVVSPVSLRPIDSIVVAFQNLANRNEIESVTIPRWLVNTNVLLRALINSGNEDTLMARWKETSTSSTNQNRDETFSAALIRILHETICRLLTNSRENRGQTNEILTALISDYFYLLLNIVENAKQFRTSVGEIRQILIRDERDETVDRLDSFSYLTTITENLKLVSTGSICLILQWAHLLNRLDFIDEPWWSSVISIPSPSSTTTHLMVTGLLQSYCDLINRHELYVEHLTSIITHRNLLLVLFEQTDSCSYVHNLFGLINRTPSASHLLVESIYTNWDFLLTRNNLLFSLKIVRIIENVHLDCSGLVLIVLFEELLKSSYFAVLRLGELIVCRRIEMILTVDQKSFEEKFLVRHGEPLVQSIKSVEDRCSSSVKSNEHLWSLVKRLSNKLTVDIPTEEKSSIERISTDDDDLILNSIREISLAADFSPKIYVEIVKNLSEKKLNSFFLSTEFQWISMEICLKIGSRQEKVWRAARAALMNKIGDVCFSLPAERNLSRNFSFHDDENSPESIFVTKILKFFNEQTNFVPLIDSISLFFESIEQQHDLDGNLTNNEARDILRLIVFLGIFISIRIELATFISISTVQSFLRVFNKTFYFTNSTISRFFHGNEQLLSVCALARTFRSILQLFTKNFPSSGAKNRRFFSAEHLSGFIENDPRPIFQHFLNALEDLNEIYERLDFVQTLPNFLRTNLRSAIILLFRIPSFNSFIRIPKLFWQQSPSDVKKLHVSNQDFTLLPFPVEILQHSDVMTDYVERISFLGWISRTQFQEIWVTFLSAINSSTPSSLNNENGQQNAENQVSREEIIENNATLCIWVRGVTTFLLNALRLYSSGNPADRKFHNRPRSLPMNFLLTPEGGKYLQTRQSFETDHEELFINLERLATNDPLSYGQISFDTVVTTIQNENSSPLPLTGLSTREGPDLMSSLQILIEIYTRWLKSNPNTICLQLKYEIFRSFIYLSDLFTSTQQFTILHELCDEYLNLWIDEDDLMISLITYGFCKCGLILGNMKKEHNELYIRLIERNLKFVTKTSAYACAMFLLESHEEDLLKSIQTIFNQEWTAEIVNNNGLKTSLDIRINAWILSMFFYVLENTATDLNWYLSRDDLLKNVDPLTKHLIAIGVERLLLLNKHSNSEIWRFYQKPLTIVRESFWPNVDHLILLYADLYTLISNPNQDRMVTNGDSPNNRDNDISSNSSPLSSLENMIIESIGEFYERIKQPGTLPHEAILLLRPIPFLLNHHNLYSRLMNKIVIEFATSIHQLYPQVLAHTVFVVFRDLIAARNSREVNEWTLWSMTGVAQRKPIRMAIWGLTCLFLSACPSTTIANALFPLALSRFNARFINLDRQLFFLASEQFYLPLTETERGQFEQSLMNDANRENIFVELIDDLNSKTSNQIE